MRFLKLSYIFLVSALNVISSWGQDTWAEKLGFPEGKKVIILHADDVGMCAEANEAAIFQLEANEIQSASVMVPCPAFAEMAAWSKSHEDYDIGLHLTLTSEWKTHRWGPIMPKNLVPGLVDEENKLWHEVKQVVAHASAEEIERELRAQIETAIRSGLQPDHLDTHMGTLYADNSYTDVYFRLAEEYKIPAMVIEFSSEQMIEKYKKQGYPITDRLLEMIKNYRLPKLDYFTSVESASTYEEKKEKFIELVASLPAGLSEIIFHPSINSEKLKSITNSWQQRVWEAEMFRDPEIVKFFKKQDIIFTNWREVMMRFQRG